MADINNFIDPKLVDTLVKLNDQLVIAGTNIDKIIPSIKKLEKEQAKLGKNTKDNNTERKKLTANEKEAAKIAKQLAASESKLESLQKGQQDALIKTKTELQKTTKATKDLQRAQAAQKGSTEQLSAVNAILEKRLKNVNQTTDKGKKSADSLRSAIDKNNKKISEQSSALTKQKIGIGGYTEGIKEAFGELGIFGGALSKASSFQEKFNKLVTGSGKSFKAAAKGTSGASKALKIFKVALISTGIGLIVVAIGAFVALLSKTQKFTDALNVALSAVGAVMDVLVGTVSKLAGVFSKLFKQPLSKTFKEAGDAVDGLSDSIVEAAKKGAELEKLRQSVKRLGFEFDVSNAKAMQQVELLKAIADDATKSFAERKKANQDAIESQEKASAAEFELFTTRKKLADAEFERLKATGNLNDEARAAHSVATKEFIEAETQRLLIQRDLEKQRTELKQDELEKDLDILIDGFDNIKTINEKIISDDKKTLGERQQLLDSTVDLSEKSFNKQIETIRKFTKIQFDENELLAEQDAVLLNDKIRGLGLSEIIEGRLLEIIREQRIATLDLADAQAELNDERKEGAIVIESLISRGVVKNEKRAKESAKLETAKIEERSEKRKKQAETDQEQLDNDAEIKKQRDQEVFNKSVELGNVLFGFRQQKLAAELAAAEGNEAKQKEIRQKQAKTEKAQALFNIAIGTAEGIIKTIANVGFPLAIPLIALTGAIGLAQSVAVASRPIPQFAKGTNYSPGGVAELGERGRELVQNPSGEVWMAENRGLYNLQQGSKVLTNQKTEAILNDGRMVGGLARIEKAIKRQPRQRSESQFTKRQRGYRDGYLASKNRLN